MAPIAPAESRPVGSGAPVPRVAGKRSRSGWSWPLRLLGTAALLFGIFWFIPFAEVVAVFRRVDPGYLAGGFALFLASLYLQAVQIALPLRRVGMSLGTWRVLQVNMITRFYGQFLPSELMAGALKLHRLAGPTRQWGEVTAVLVLARVVDMLALIGLGTLLWAIEMPAGAGRWIGVAMLGLAGALVTGHLLVGSPRVERLARTVLPAGAWARLDQGIPGRILNVARATTVSYRRFGAVVLIPLAGVSLLRHVLGIVTFSLFALSVGVELSYLTIGWIRVVLYLVVMLPISVSGVGVREGSLVFLLQDYGVAPSEAVAIAFLLFAAALIANGLGGVFELRNLLGGARRRAQRADPSAGTGGDG